MIAQPEEMIAEHETAGYMNSELEKMLFLGDELNEKRKVWLLRSFLDKIVARGNSKANLGIQLKRAFEKFDRDGSGELDLEEFRLAMEEHLPGIDENEFVALARSFDKNGDEVISIKEFIENLTQLKDDATLLLPGSHTQTQGKPPMQRRPEMCGTEARRTHEFFDDGYNRKPKACAEEEEEKDPELIEFFTELKQRALKKLLATTGDVNALVQLIQRAFERQKSTAKARHLTRPQFRQALMCFDDTVHPSLVALIDIDILYKKCHNGNYTEFMHLFQHYTNPQSVSQSTAADDSYQVHTLTKAQKRILKLKHQLLDKINERSTPFGSGFRIKLKRIVRKFDVDDSGELEMAEFERAFAELLPGVNQQDINALVLDFDTDRNGALSVDEVAKSLMRLQQERNPNSTSLTLARKKPLHTKSGARGLS